MKFVVFQWIIAVALSICFKEAPCQAYDGKIVEISRYQIPSYGELPKWVKDKYTQRGYNDEFVSGNVEQYKLKYLSDGLRVNGFIFKPKAGPTTGLPVIIYNRGGIGENAKIGVSNFLSLYEMNKLAGLGYLVMASQYRGIDGGEGSDEVGGSDVNDVLNLLSVAKSLKYADSSRIYMVGASRGGTMTLQALKAGAKLKAVAVTAAVTDWKMQLAGNDDFGKKFWPNYEKDKEQHFARRSAVQWVETLNAPILFLQGGNDESVSPLQTLRFIEKLEENRKLYQFVVFAGDDHMLNGHIDERLDLIADWFNEFK